MHQTIKLFFFSKKKKVADLSEVLRTFRDRYYVIEDFIAVVLTLSVLTLISQDFKCDQ